MESRPTSSSGYASNLLLVKSPRQMNEASRSPDPAQYLGPIRGTTKKDFFSL